MSAVPKLVPLSQRNGWKPRPGSRFRRRQRKPWEQAKGNGWSLWKPVKGGFFRTAFRMIEVTAVVFYFAVWVSLIWLITRDPRARLLRRAQAFRDVFEILGGAFIKIGQQLSNRQDMLKIEYCDALKDLLDNVKEFDFSLAEKAITEQLKRPIDSVFKNLNRNPIGRASIACVYEAWLYEGHESAPVRVAIKVRRPGIVKQFAADLRALDWVLIVLEYLTVFRRGISRNFRFQMKQILFDELDFIKEARYQEIFRRRYRKKKRKRYHVTAPKVFYRYSGRAVMVSEFVDAIPLESVTGAIAAADKEYLSYLHSLDIDPVQLAKRLVRFSYDAFFEGPFFHGDPHPANIMVLPNSKLVFLDFGACGTFSNRDRHLMLQMHYSHSQKDIRGMVQSVIGLMEPLPPMDVDEFRNKLEKEYWDGYYGILSKHSDWRDRTSFRLWVALYDLIREYNVPMPLTVVRMIRATLMYDTVAAQLYNRIDVFKEFRKYHKVYARRVRNKLIRSAVRQALRGPDLKWYVIFNRVLKLGRTALFRLQKLVDENVFESFQAVANKVYFFIKMGVQLMVSVLTVNGGFWLALNLLFHLGLIKLDDGAVSLGQWIKWVLEPLATINNPFVKAVFSIHDFLIFSIIFVHMNALRLRFNDPDHYGDD